MFGLWMYSNEEVYFMACGREILCVRTARQKEEVSINCQIMHSQETVYFMAFGVGANLHAHGKTKEEVSINVHRIPVGTMSIRFLGPLDGKYLLQPPYHGLLGMHSVIDDAYFFFCSCPARGNYLPSLRP